MHRDLQVCVGLMWHRLPWRPDAWVASNPLLRSLGVPTRLLRDVCVCVRADRLTLLHLGAWKPTTPQVDLGLPFAGESRRCLNERVRPLDSARETHA